MAIELYLLLYIQIFNDLSFKIQVLYLISLTRLHVLLLAKLTNFTVFQRNSKFHGQQKREGLEREVWAWFYALFWSTIVCIAALMHSYCGSLMNSTSIGYWGSLMKSTSIYRWWVASYWSINFFLSLVFLDGQFSTEIFQWFFYLHFGILL